jgi:outer membrane protein TolC
MAGNPRLKALAAEVTAAQQGLAAAEAADRPVLSGEAEAAVYNRMTNSTHPLGIGLVLEVPLATGGAGDAKIAAARAELREARARLDQARLELRQSVLDLWLELDTLRLRHEELRTLADYRELYLDRSRALYELEVRTDLGDAMVQTSAVRLLRAEAAFQWQLAQARLQALGGQLLGDDGADGPREEDTP